MWWTDLHCSPPCGRITKGALLFGKAFLVARVKAETKGGKERRNHKFREFLAR